MTPSLRRVRARVLLAGISSDWLFPEGEVRALARRMSSAGVQCRYEELASPHGHDGFLADAELRAPLLSDALSEQHGRAAPHAA